MSDAKTERNVDEPFDQDAEPKVPVSGQSQPDSTTGEPVNPDSFAPDSFAPDGGNLPAESDKL